MTDDDELDRLSGQLDRIAARMRAEEMHATVTASQRPASVLGDPKLTAFLERNAQEVAAWPAWKRDAQRNTSCGHALCAYEPSDD